MKQFDAWNDVKKSAEENNDIARFREKEIFATAIGQNVGFEQNGKGDEFLRPVLIYKKFSNRLFMGIPLSKTLKDGVFYHSFEFQAGVISTAVLSQMRLFDAKRLRYRMGMINTENFETIKSKPGKLLGVTP